MAPKQLQSGVSPRRSAFVIPAANASSSTSAPTAPQVAEGRGTSATATAGSAKGSAVPRTAAGRRGTPKPASDAREPRRSASFPAAATAKTAASSRRAASSAELMPSGRGCSEAAYVQPVVDGLQQTVFPVQQGTVGSQPVGLGGFEPHMQGQAWPSSVGVTVQLHTVPTQLQAWQELLLETQHRWLHDFPAVA